MSPLRSLSELEWLLGDWRASDGLLTTADDDLGAAGAPCSVYYCWSKANDSFILERVRIMSGDNVREHMTALIGIDQSVGAVAMWTFRFDGTHGRSEMESDGRVTRMHFVGCAVGGAASMDIEWTRISEDSFCRQFKNIEKAGKRIPDSTVSYVSRVK